MYMKNKIEKVLDILLDSTHCIALTGAGISTLSGIPDFRSPHTGLWNRYDAEKIFLINHFYKTPEYFFNFAREFLPVFQKCQPNIIHNLLTVLQRLGIIKRVITQNIDMLHQRAGSTDVLELHGSPERNYCLECHAVYRIDEFMHMLSTQEIPRCETCGGIIKPDIVFFGEMLHEEVIGAAFREAQKADCCIVLGSSLVVYPAASIPEIVYEHGNGDIIIVNRDPTPLDRYAAVLLPVELDTFGKVFFDVLHDRKIIQET